MGLRILVLPPLWEALPPKGYGAIEYLAAAQVEEFVAMGHDVTTIASGDSSLSGRLDAIVPKALNHTVCPEPELVRLLQFSQALNNAENYDIIHCHLHSNSGWLGLPLLAPVMDRTVFSLHTFATEDNRKLLSHYPDANYVAASRSHQDSFKLPFINKFIHHGIRLRDFPFHQTSCTGSEPYLAFLGRLRPEKGVHVAIQAAKKMMLPLKIGGRVKNSDMPYFKDYIEPSIKDGSIEFVGELNPLEKVKFMGEAVAVVNPTLIDEPFGLVVIEAMACGTPVLATPYGAMKELITHGKTGLLFSERNLDVLAKETIFKIDRNEVRKSIEQKFTYERMAHEYTALFEDIAVAPRSSSIRQDPKRKFVLGL